MKTTLQSRNGLSTTSDPAVGLQGLVSRLGAAKRRLRYHTRPGHGASKTRLSSGEAKDLAGADVENLTWHIERLKSAND
jgi:hypothetical protein